MCLFMKWRTDKYANRSANFFICVDKIMPDYIKCKNWLRTVDVAGIRLINFF